MSNPNEVPTNSSSKIVDKKAQQDKTAAKNTSSRAFLFVTLLIALIALLSAFYAIYTTRHLQQGNDQQTEALNQDLASLKQQQITNHENLTKLKQIINQSQLSLQDQMQKLNRNLQTAMQERLYQKQDWILLRARYYLELAQINAYWTDDQQATIALLKQADTLLATLADQRLFAVRQALAKEMTELQALPKPDITGLLSQLDAAQHAVATLAIKQPLRRSAPNKEVETPSSSWREGLKSSLSALEKLVVIRRNKEDLQPLLSPLEQRLLGDSIRLNLQEVQWAILQNNAAVYQLALRQALQGIKRAFDEKAPATQALIKKLQDLQELNLLRPRIKLEQTLPLLNQLIESKNSQAIANPATSKGGKNL